MDRWARWVLERSHGADPEQRRIRQEHLAEIVDGLSAEMRAAFTARVDVADLLS